MYARRLAKKLGTIEEEIDRELKAGRNAKL